MSGRFALSAALIGLLTVITVGGMTSGAAWADVRLGAYSNEVEVNQIEAGHEIMMRIRVSDVSDLYGCAFDLLYDPDVFQVIDTFPNLDTVYPKLTEGEVLNESGAAETFRIARLENGQAGRLAMGITRKGAVSGVNVGFEESLLITIHFQAVQPNPDITTISFDRQGIIDSGLSPVVVGLWENTGMTIIELNIRKLDINDDEQINLADIILSMQVLTQIPTSEPVFQEAEFSGDGIIGSAEAVAILQILADLRADPQ